MTRSGEPGDPGMTDEQAADIDAELSGETGSDGEGRKIVEKVETSRHEVEVYDDDSAFASPRSKDPFSPDGGYVPEQDQTLGDVDHSSPVYGVQESFERG